MERLPPPKQLLWVREMGDASGEYWQPLVDADGGVIPDEGETALWAGTGYVSFGASSAERTFQITITDQRIVWSSKDFEKGGGWVGFGVVGLTVATTANAVSRRRAKARIAGTVLVGHVRYEWIGLVKEQQTKTLLGGIQHDTRLLVPLADQLMEVRFSGGTIGRPEMAEWVSQVARVHRLGLADWLSDEDRAVTETFVAEHAGQIAGMGSSRVTAWPFPGDCGALSHAAYQRWT